MDIQSIKLRGMIGIKKGMGLDEIALDFSNMNGMIAIAGDTGIGKSSIMENLHPYPRLVSRPNPALKNHVFLRDSMKELSFIHNGDLFRTVTKIDSESGRTEGFIYVNDSSKSENDGKITTYKQFMETQFGSTDLFFNSVFCAQNSKKMSAMDPADLKSLFVEFLGPRLQILVDQEETAKACSNILINRIDTLDRDISRQNAIILETGTARELLKTAEGEKEASELSIKRIQETLGKLSKDLADANKAKLLAGADQEKITALEKDIETYQTELDKITIDRDRAISQLDKEITANEAAIDECTTILDEKDAIEGAADLEKTLTQDVNEIQNKRIVWEKSLKAIEASLSRDKDRQHEAYKAHQAKLEAARTAARELIEKRKDAAADIKTARDGIDKEDPELFGLTEHLERYRGMVKDLERRGTVTLNGTEFPCNSENCPFVEKALGAKKQIPEFERRIQETETRRAEEKKALQKRVELLTEEKETLNADIDRATSEGKTMVSAYEEAERDLSASRKLVEKQADGISKEIESIDNEIARLQSELKTAQDLSSKLPEIQIAQTKIDGLFKARKSISEAMHKTKREYGDRISARQVKITGFQEDVDRLKKGIDPTLSHRIIGIEVSIEKENKNLAGAQSLLKENEASIIRLQQEVGTADTAAVELKQLQGKRKLISTEQSDWEYIKVKCGANGLRALEINSVAPSITHDANQLLEKAFGAWAMVDFCTLDENGKEVLRPMVIDQDGESVLVANRSGGQQVWAMKAMRLAMTGVSKQISGFNYKTAYADEDDAGLDVETAKSFTKLYRAFLMQGGFNKCIYISHKRECVELADHVIRLGQGGVQ